MGGLYFWLLMVIFVDDMSDIINHGYNALLIWVIFVLFLVWLYKRK